MATREVVVPLVLFLALLTDAVPAQRFPHLDWQQGEGGQVSCPECHCRGCPQNQRCCWKCGNGDCHSGETPGHRCVCRRQEVLCGSDQRTYKNMCQFQEARSQLRDEQKLSVAHRGPCRTKPTIVSPPRDITVVEGSDIIFRCDVASYPVAVIEWKKEGNSLFLPADDSNMMVQAHRGQRQPQLTGWLRILTVGQADRGLYTCTARSAFGEASANARLQVLDRDSQPAPRQQQETPATLNISDDEDYDNEDYEAMSSGTLY